MNAPAKVKKAEEDNLRIWNKVSKTDPKHTKRVNQRGGFTAIDAQYQIMMATETFGPIGEGWGYEVGSYELVGGLIVVPVTLWHSGDRTKTFGPILGCAEMLGQRPDRDAPKKAMTDAITKGLSQLGFNADVFLGLFDDNKYVEQVGREFADANEGKTSDCAPKEKDGDLSPSALKASLKLMVHHVNGAGDLDELIAILETEDTKEVIEQCKRRAPAWWETGEGMPAEFTPLKDLIENRRKELEAADSAASMIRAG